MQIIALFNPGLFIRNTITICINELIRFTPLDLSGTFSIQRKRSQKVKPGLRIFVMRNVGLILIYMFVLINLLSS
jgi:hypothetical protein